MKNQKLWDLYINWKGLELIHSVKSVLRIILIILSIVFAFISLSIQNYYVLGTSLIILFLQILSDNNKEYYLKYKEIFEKVNDGKNYNSYKEWISYLEKTIGLNSFYKGVFSLLFKSKYTELTNEKLKHSIK